MGFMFQVVSFHGGGVVGIGVGCKSVGDVEVAGVRAAVGVVPHSVCSFEDGSV